MGPKLLEVRWGFRSTGSIAGTGSTGPFGGQERWIDSGASHSSAGPCWLIPANWLSHTEIACTEFSLFCYLAQRCGPKSTSSEGLKRNMIRPESLLSWARNGGKDLQ